MTHSSHLRFRRVLDHMDVHLDGDLSLETLARVAAWSPFHFHRRFSALTGMTVHRYVQLSRFKRAAWQAAFRPDASMTTIALDAGYESPDAFTRAFRQRLGQSPSAFREAPDWRVWATAWRELDEVRRFHMPAGHRLDEVRIVDVSPVRVACLPHVGDPARIGESVRRFIAWRRATGLSPSRSATWNVLHDDPETTPPERYRLDICASCDVVEANDAGIVAGTIEGGRCAVLRHTGSDALLGDAIRFLYADWLTASDEEPRDAPLFLQRVAFFPDVPEHEAVTDIYLPLGRASSPA
ncbi:AraC family transcriptional regulator [Luteibacter sp. UNC138MFCol5.1]|uniref:AraC family transcriptional regulator n=1 Tax=Luteibacter sp. UNC138MFCol5.1 TaxID=1502774 RepID=UPI0008D22133|nr:AraC family transcriptional regulator [Luteibacter sp. UNC138MFCol5.1]SEO78172.1 AraC family transcriptional regulator [Luteibacter sp. UNC138MFCol5.1]